MLEPSFFTTLLGNPHGGFLVVHLLTRKAPWGEVKTFYVTFPDVAILMYQINPLKTKLDELRSLKKIFLNSHN